MVKSCVFLLLKLLGNCNTVTTWWLVHS